MKVSYLFLKVLNLENYMLRKLKFGNPFLFRIVPHSFLSSVALLHQHFRKNTISIV